MSLLATRQKYRWLLEKACVCDLFSTLTRKSDDSRNLHLSENITSVRTTPTPTRSENMTQQVLRLAEKINDQYLTCKICLVWNTKTNNILH
jgi:hypothetical protein